MERAENVARLVERFGGLVPPVELQQAPCMLVVRVGRTSSLRSTSASRSWIDGSSHPHIAASAPDQNTLPTTAASCRSVLSSWGS